MRQGGHQAGPAELRYLPLRGHGYYQPFLRANASVFTWLGDAAREGRRTPSYSRHRAQRQPRHQLQSVPSISESSLAKAPTPKKKMKKAACLTPAKRWGNFQRQASRRKKAVALTKEEYLRLVAQPCVYCATRGKMGVDHERNSDSYTRENAAP